MNILILYAEIMPYNLPVWRYMRDKGCKLTVVQLDDRKLTPFKYEGEEGIEVHNITSYPDYKSFKDKFYKRDNKLVLMCEGPFKWYWRLARYYHKTMSNIPVIVGVDAQWTGKRNNYIKKFLFPFIYGRVFTNVQCAGLWQVMYALKIGFKRNQIIKPFYCAQNEIYYTVDIDKKRKSYPKRFIFIGRFNEVKGIREMIEAWQNIKDKHGWSFTMVGNGPMEDEIQRYKDIIDIRPFMQQEDIANLMQESGCSMIPSRFEPWGLVIHEAAAAGMPMIVSRDCGATNQFAIDGYNGIVINEVTTASVQNAMERIINTSDDELLTLAENSREMSKSIQPGHVANALLSLIR